MKLQVAVAVACATAVWAATTGTLYSVPPVLTPAPNNSSFGITFLATPGALYDLETSTNLLDWDWLETVRARTAVETFADPSSTNLQARFYRVADLSPNITIEGVVESTDEPGVPPPFVLVSSSLDSATAYTDEGGRYVLRTSASATANNVPFTLFFSKVAYRPHSVVVGNPVLPRVDRISLAGPSNNDFTNRFIIAGTGEGRDQNIDADLEPGEPGTEPSVWYSFTAPRGGMLKFVVDTPDFEPVLGVFKGSTLAALQPVERGTVSNYVETRIEKTVELSVFSGERLHFRVGALPHPTRDLQAGYFDWRLTFTDGFRLDLGAYDEQHGNVTVNPAPNDSGHYVPGTRVNLNATPAGNYRFGGWSGTMNSGQRNIAVIMNEAKHLQPHFDLGNGDPADATMIQGATPQGQSLVPEDGVVWYSWRAPKDMPTTLLFETTNFLHATVYAVDESTNLIRIADNRPGDHAAVQFGAVEGQMYKWAVNFESNESGVFRFRLYESILMQGDVSPREAFTVNSPLLSSPSRTYVGSGFEIWTRVPATAANFPYTVTVSSRYYRPVMHTIQGNEERPTYVLTFPGPSNNDFTNAIHITAATGSIAGLLYQADAELGEPGSPDGSVWYRYRPPADGTVTFTTHVNVRETTVWKGSSLSGLTLQPGIERDRPTMHVVTESTVNGGRDNYIRFAGETWHWWASFNSSYLFRPGYPLYLRVPQTNAGSVAVTPSPASGRYAPGTLVTLTASPEPGYRFAGWTGDVDRSTNRVTVTMNSLKQVQANFRLKNDRFADAIALSGLPASGRGGNQYGTSESGEPHHCGLPATSSAWWKWTSGAVARDVVLDFDYVDFTALISVYTGNSLSTLHLVANNTVGFNERQVRFRALPNTTYRIAVDAYNGNGGELTFTIRRVDEARYRLKIPAVQGGYVAADPRPDGNGEYASGTWVTLRAHPVNAFDFHRWQETSSGSAVSRGGTNGLRVRMDRSREIRAAFLATNDVRGNDRFADRLMILPGTVTEGTNTNATTEAGEPIHHVAQSGRTLWWSWTAERYAPVAISTAGSSFSNVLCVYAGESPGSLSRVASALSQNETMEARLWFTPVAGTTYHIAVDGLNGISGSISLRLVENEQFTVNFLQPRQHATFSAPADIPIFVAALNSDLTVTQINVMANGMPYASMHQPPFHAVLSNVAAGVYQLDATALDRHGRTNHAQPVVITVGGFRFGSNTLNASERDGVVNFEVHRVGPADLPARLYVETLPGTAMAGEDYAPMAGYITLQSGYGLESGTVPLYWDDEVEEMESFQLLLRNSPGGHVLHAATVLVHDSIGSREMVWIDDAFPTGVVASGSFRWIDAEPPPFSGARARESSGSHEILGASALNFGASDVLFQDVWIDPLRPPSLLTIKWRFNGPFYYGLAHWGEAALRPAWGLWMGPLPAGGGWVRLNVPGKWIGSITIDGFEWNSQGVRVVWDRTGKLH
jgi:hypothetical protein